MMWGDRSPRAKLSAHSRSGCGAVLIVGSRSFRSLARNWPLRLLRLLQHGVIPESSQTRARESALQESMGPASCGLATMERGNGILCRTWRVVEADIDLCSGPDGIDRARGRGRLGS